MNYDELPPDGDVLEFRKQRELVFEKVKEWTGKQYDVREYVARLIGHQHSDMTAYQHQTEVKEQLQKLRALNGPYGFAFYKMLLARQREEINDDRADHG